MIYLQLFWEFFKTGLFSVGGGLATLPFLSRMSSRFGWFTQEDLGNMLAVSESTPGPIGVNMATYVGNLTGGIVGGLDSAVLSGDFDDRHGYGAVPGKPLCTGCHVPASSCLRWHGIGGRAGRAAICASECGRGQSAAVEPDGVIAKSDRISRAAGVVYKI